jgi:Flp pilus assembly protein TadG
VRGLRNFLLLHRDQSGQVAVIVALLMVVLFGFMAVAIDLGVLRHQKRQMQTVADAAAIAGALNLPLYAATGGTTLEFPNVGVTAGAQIAASQNGFTSGGNNTLTVNNPPVVSVPYGGNTGCVEVIASQSGSTYFANILGIKSMTAAARAVACQTSSPNCIYVTDTSGTDVTVTGSGGGGNLNASCGIVVNSSSPSAISVTGSGGGGQISATSIGVVGKPGYTDTGGKITPTPVSNIIPASDPLAYLPQPTVGACTHPTTVTVSGTTTLNPGVYCGGLNIVTSGSATVTFNPGLYIFTGSSTGISFIASGSLTVNGTGVTFYNNSTSGSMSFTGSGSTNFNLTAPTTGTYAGILMFQNQNNTAAGTVTASGSTTEIFQGATYFPNAPLNYTASGSSGAAAYSIIVAQTLKITGSGTSAINDTYTSLPGGLSPIQTAVLVE